MAITRRTVLAGLGAAPALAGCAPLTVLDTLVPKDGGSRREATDIAYGPGARHRLDIYRPETASGPAPVVVFVYGGGWNSGSKSDYTFAGRAFASRGFVTVVPDYRLVPEIRFPTFLEDCAAAVRWTREHIAEHGGDPARIHLAGHSAGAYNVVMLGLDRHYLAEAGFRGPPIRGVAALSGPYDFLPLDVDATKQAFSQTPDLARTQPINFVRRDAPPMFLATGDADDTVYPRNTHTLADRLRKAGARVTEKTYPGIGHPGILLALTTSFRDRAPVLDDMVAFMKSTG